MIKLSVLFFSVMVSFLSFASDAGSEEQRYYNLDDFIPRVLSTILMVVVLVWIYNKFIKGRLEKYSSVVDVSVNKSELEKKEAKAELAGYRLLLEDLGKSIEHMKEEQLKELELERERILKDTEVHIASMKEHAKLMKEREIDNAKDAVIKNIKELSIENAEKKLKKLNIDEIKRYTLTSIDSL